MFTYDDYKNAVDTMAREMEGCIYFYLGSDNQLDYALVIGYDDEFGVMAKIGCQDKHSFMQCDYDIDWEMPIDENLDVWDTNMSVGGTTEEFEWYMDEWDDMKDYLILYE